MGCAEIGLYYPELFLMLESGIDDVNFDEIRLASGIRNDIDAIDL